MCVYALQRMSARRQRQSTIHATVFFSQKTAYLGYSTYFRTESSIFGCHIFVSTSFFYKLFLTGRFSEYLEGGVDPGRNALDCLVPVILGAFEKGVVQRLCGRAAKFVVSALEQRSSWLVLWFNASVDEQRSSWLVL